LIVIVFELGCRLFVVAFPFGGAGVVLFPLHGLTGRLQSLISRVVGGVCFLKGFSHHLSARGDAVLSAVVGPLAV
jgi:hypothetical protein